MRSKPKFYKYLLQNLISTIDVSFLTSLSKFAIKMILYYPVVLDDIENTWVTIFAVAVVELETQLAVL